MKNKTICGALIAIGIITSCMFGLKYDVNSDKNINVHFSEEFLSENSLIEKSSSIVLGKIKERKYKKTENKKPKESDAAGIVWTYSVYTLEVKDIIDGKVPKKIDIVFGGNKPEDIELNKEYVFFLEKDMIGDNSYHLTSYSQGVFEVQGDEYENKNTKMIFKKDSLLEKVKKLK